MGKVVNVGELEKKLNGLKSGERIREEGLRSACSGVVAILAIAALNAKVVAGIGKWALILFIGFFFYHTIWTLIGSLRSERMNKRIIEVRNLITDKIQTMDGMEVDDPRTAGIIKEAKAMADEYQDGKSLMDIEMCRMQIELKALNKASKQKLRELMAEYGAGECEGCEECTPTATEPN